jgi:hypothetical protein
MAGLSANNIFYSTTTIVAMLMGRYVLAVLALALAGSFAAAPRRPPSRGSMPSDGMTFGVLLSGTTLLVGALNFLPALAMGPIAEHFSMNPWHSSHRCQRPNMWPPTSSSLLVLSVASEMQGLRRQVRIWT